MKEDIVNAQLTAGFLAGKLQKLKMQPKVETNILVLDLAGLNTTPAQFCEMAQKKGLLIKTVLQTCVRLVYYKGITAADAERAAAIILELDKEIN